MTKPWRSLAHLQETCRQPGLLNTLIRGASTALTIQTAGIGIGYLMQVLLARWMGATEYGTYDYVITLSMVLAFIAGLGLSNAVLRFVPEYTVKQDWARLRGIVWGSWWQTTIASVMISGLMAVSVLWLLQTQPLASSLQVPLLAGIGMIPVFALTKLQLEMARAMRQISLAYAPSLMIYPLLLILAAFVWQRTQGNLTSTETIVLSMITLLLVLGIQLWVFHQGLMPEVSRVRPIYALRQWLLVSLPLLFIDGSFVVLNQTDTLMIGAFLGAKDVGIYSAAFKTATWVSFILLAVNAIAAPLFSTLYAQGDRQELQRLVSMIARWMFYPAFLVAIGLFIFAEPVLHLFGAEFVAAKWAMVALCLGQLVNVVNVGAGSVGYLLTMTGHQNQCAFVVGCSALMNVMLNLIFIPVLGILGAAIATACSMALWNIWLNTLVVKYLGVNPSIVATLWGRSRE